MAKQVRRARYAFITFQKWLDFQVGVGRIDWDEIYRELGEK